MVGIITFSPWKLFASDFQEKSYVTYVIIWPSVEDAEELMTSIIT